MDRFGYQRRRMVEKHIAGRGVRDPRVLEVMRQIPRHEFVRDNLKGEAYGDHALPIDSGQTISQPYIVARMTEMLDVHPEHSVLEIGTGSGYQTLVLARLARRVYSLERVQALARKAIERLRPFGLDNVKIQSFDGTVGWSDVAPFDRIMVTAGAPRVPRPLLDQLAEGGKLVIPEGGQEGQRLVLYVKTAEGIERLPAEPVTFVPLIGRHGWPDPGRGDGRRRALQWFAEGRVQGVSYRWFTQQVARGLGLRGWIRNLPDGRVEVQAEGPADALAKLEESLRQGPDLARVDRLFEQEIDRSTITTDDFEIRF